MKEINALSPISYNQLEYVTNKINNYYSIFRINKDEPVIDLVLLLIDALPTDIKWGLHSDVGVKIELNKDGKGEDDVQLFRYSQEQIDFLKKLRKKE